MASCLPQLSWYGTSPYSFIMWKWISFVLYGMTLFHSFTLFCAAKIFCIFIESCTLSLFYVFCYWILIICGSKETFCIANGFQCLCWSYWLQLMTNIWTVLYVTWDCVLHQAPSVAFVTYSSDTVTSVTCSYYW